jgi:hypothetical protein
MFLTNATCQAEDVRAAGSFVVLVTLAANVDKALDETLRRLFVFLMK